MNTASLYLHLTDSFLDGVSIDTAKGSEAIQCEAAGYVRATSAPLEAKRCCVYVTQEQPPGRFGEFARKHGLETACGILEISAGAEAGEYNDAPVTVALTLAGAAYAEVAAIIRLCHLGGAQAACTLLFTHSTQAVFSSSFPDLSQLDLSVRESFPVVGVQFRLARVPNGRVDVPKHPYEPSMSVAAMFRTTLAKVDASQNNSEFLLWNIELTGRIVCKKLGIDDDTEIKFREFDRDTDGPGYEKAGYAGTLSAWQHQGKPTALVELFATRAGLDDLGMLLRQAGPSDAITIELNCRGDGQPLKGDERRDLWVTHFRVSANKVFDPPRR